MLIMKKKVRLVDYKFMIWMIMKVEKFLMTLTVTNISGYGGRDNENYDDGWFISLSQILHSNHYHCVRFIISSITNANENFI